MVHFVLVHGVCHGAWCWYKVKPVLESAGHRVTAFDLAASGTDMTNIQNVHTFFDYTLPLIEFMDSLPPEEKVTLVGHSLAGLNMALVMDKFPQKISMAVFLAAHMPDCTHSPSYSMDELIKRTPAGFWLDTQVSPDLNPINPKNVVVFGIKCLATNHYQLSPSEDLALAELLTRPGSMFYEDISKLKPFTEEGYGSVSRVYIVCNKDLTFKEDFQRWMIENNPVKEVIEIEDADHMPMFSTPKELCDCLLDIANKYN